MSSEGSLRVFVNNVDTYLGNAVCADLRSVLERPARISGTVMGENNVQVPPSVKRLVSRSEPKNLMKTILGSQICIFDLHSSDLEEVEFVLKALKIAAVDQPLVLIIVSSVFCWGRTKCAREPLNPEEEEEEAPPPGDDEDAEPVVKPPVETIPCVMTDKDWKRRRPAVGVYEAWKTIETLALALNSRANITAYVVGAGVMYGNGEDKLYPLFQAGWLCGGNIACEQSLRVIGDGKNFIPTVHVRDVARLVKQLSLGLEGTQYFLCVDAAHSTQREIVEAIAKRLTDMEEGETMPSVEPEQAVLAHESEVLGLLDLRFSPSEIMERKREFKWWSREGIVKNVTNVAEEFCKWRNLSPLKIALLGPPASGKSFFGNLLSSGFNVPHVTAKIALDFILEKCNKLQKEMEEKEEEAEEMREKADPVVLQVMEAWQKAGSVKGSAPRLPPDSMCQVMKYFLKRNDCKYRGYLLDGFPRNFEEAKLMFELPKEEEEEGEEQSDEPPPLDSAILPEFLCILESAKEACKERLIALPEEEVQGTHNDEPNFNRRWETYQKANYPTDGVTESTDTWFASRGIKAFNVEVDQSASSVLPLLRSHIEAQGRPFNYLQTVEDEVKPEEEKTQEEEDTFAANEQEEQEKIDSLIMKQQEERKANESKKAQKIAAAELELLESQSAPLREYLKTYVVPTLTDGLIEVCKVMPEDPIDYLAEYLFAHAEEVKPPQFDEKEHK